MADDAKRYQSYEAFWPFYLRQHSKRATRQMHVVGTLSGFLVLLLALLTLHLLWIPLALLLGYGFAWVAHHFKEGNRPATFSYPLWSLRGDFRMLWLWLGGQLELELRRHKIFT